MEMAFHCVSTEQPRKVFILPAAIGLANCKRVSRNNSSSRDKVVCAHSRHKSAEGTVDTSLPCPLSFCNRSIAPSGSTFFDALFLFFELKKMVAEENGKTKIKKSRTCRRQLPTWFAVVAIVGSVVFLHVPLHLVTVVLAFVLGAIVGSSFLIYRGVAASLSFSRRLGVDNPTSAAVVATILSTWAKAEEKGRPKVSPSFIPCPAWRQEDVVKEKVQPPQPAPTPVSTIFE